MLEEPLVVVENVSKKFCRRLKKSLWYGICDIGSELFPISACSDRLRPDEFWAVNDVSFELRRGECLALLGRNGAGKTTLLRMINGLIKPDKGRIQLRGRIGALIALGAGFNPVLTGRENIYVNAAVLGLTKRDVREKLDEIIDFAEIGDFIDAPVQSYSSGMQVRLGFAVAASLSPDVLILDEVLAVGDRAFQIKCLTRVGEMMEKAAVIFVSHQTELVSHIATTGIFMNAGEVAFMGNTEEAISIYTQETSNILSQNWIHSVDGVTDIQITLSPNEIGHRGSATMITDFFSTRSYPACVARVCFEDKNGRLLAEWHSAVNRRALQVREGKNRIEIRMDNIPLHGGRYNINFNLHPLKSPLYIISANHCGVLAVSSHASAPNPVQL